MNGLSKLLVLLVMLVVQAISYVVLWDGNLDRVQQAREVAAGRLGFRPLFEFHELSPAAAPAVTAPLEFFDLVERNYPAAFARHFDVPTTEGMKAVYVEARDLGRRIYIREGCIHCHTQIVRDDSRDPERWGTPSSLSSADIQDVGLPLTGLRRVGPDLDREGGRRSNDWQAAHLLRPQSILKGSIMPGYPWLFEEVEGRIEPTKAGLALIVYLQSLDGQRP